MMIPHKSNHPDQVEIRPLIPNYYNDLLDDIRTVNGITLTKIAGDALDDYFHLLNSDKYTSVSIIPEDRSYPLRAKISFRNHVKLTQLKLKGIPISESVCNALSFYIDKMLPAQNKI